ncbi:hypothetical protein COUCH_15250 [Couchioplanes caeruleus]|uniref:hypothetical protein n=1 Tax=Couchioplanes caeruleus TaxID=56438 RepID=UPI0020C08804|nr:hypothetical protein [Couchioplanes caeruleus]UQU67538.1 hypothetical protein COUCH_15250 [Couchioplanes caeruleus]
MAKHHLTDEQAAAETTVAALDQVFKSRGDDKAIRALMTPQQRDAVDRTLRDHERRTRR